MTAAMPLLRRIAAGDGPAVAECLETYGGLVRSLARRMLGTTGEAEDAVQEVFIELWRVAARFDESKGAEAAFVTTVARRRIIDRLRRYKRRPETEMLPDSLAADEASSAESAAALADEANHAHEALSQLGENQQRVIRLAVLKGMSHSEVARATDMPLGTVKTHVRRGLIRLREMLSDTPSDEPSDEPS
jgi:RNA polymerase sigma-70 factor (ECF subfamily)